MSDPFASASGNTAGDPFGQPVGGGGGKYPSMIDMRGCLLLINPTEFDPKAPGFEEGDKPRERFTVDLAILDGKPMNADDEPWEVGAWYEGMFISQGNICRVLKPQFKAKGMVLGRLQRVPRKNEAEKYPTLEKLEEAITRAARRGDKVNFSWSLAEFTPEDAKIAREFLKNPKVANADSDE
jgi:hypothetical protein